MFLNINRYIISNNSSMLLISHTFEHKFSNSFKQASNYFCDNRLIKSNHSVKIILLLDTHQRSEVAYFKLRVNR